jgi:hypothetical protein
MANAIWNPSDRTDITLTGSNLTATSNAANGVRSTIFETSGKYY